MYEPFGSWLRPLRFDDITCPLRSCFRYVWPGSFAGVPDEDSQERQRLLDLVVEHCLAEGVAELTLRRVGRAVGSNNRMLLYYFESKEQLIASTLVHAAQRFPQFQHAFELLDVADRPFDRRLDDTWKALSADVNLPFIRLFFEIFGLAAHQPGRFDVFLGSVGHDWADRVAGALRRHGVPPAAARDTGRQIVALWRGLQLDLLSSADRRHIDRAHTAAARRIAAQLEL